MLYLEADIFLQRQNDLQQNLATTLPTYISLRVYTNQGI